MHQTVKPQFTADQLMAALPKEVIAKYKLYVEEDTLYFYHEYLNLGKENQMSVYDHTIDLKSISRILIDQNCIILCLNDSALNRIVLSVKNDRICFYL